jgi:hypothetical protein
MTMTGLIYKNPPAPPLPQEAARPIYHLGRPPSDFSTEFLSLSFKISDLKTGPVAPFENFARAYIEMDCTGAIRGATEDSTGLYLIRWPIQLDVNARILAESLSILEGFFRDLLKGIKWNGLALDLDDEAAWAAIIIGRELAMVPAVQLAFPAMIQELGNWQIWDSAGDIDAAVVQVLRLLDERGTPCRAWPEQVREVVLSMAEELFQRHPTGTPGVIRKALRTAGRLRPGSVILKD